MKKIIMLLVALTLMLTAAVSGAEGDFQVVAPNGAPAVSVAVLAAENPDLYTFISADTIEAAFTKEEADFIIAPVNAGAKLYKAGKSQYRLAAVVTWGNLFFASQKEGFVPEDMKTEKLTIFGADTINASVAIYALKENGIEPVLADPLAGAAETKAILESDPEAIVLTAEPMLTAAKKSNDKITAYSVNEMLQQATGMDGYTQAGIFVKAADAQDRAEEVNAFLEQMKGAADLCSSDTDQVAEALTKLEMSFPKPAISNCSIRFVYAAEAREMVEKTAMIDLAQFGGELPADDFYYEAK